MQAALKVKTAGATRPRPGESECGDQLLRLVDGDCHLLALADGLGHGPEAARAAQVAMTIVAEHAREPLSELFRWCHQGLTHTRGVALTLLRIDALARTAVCAGVGNVEVVTVARESARPVLSAGVVGMRLRRVIETRMSLHEGDLFVLHTDGISSRFSPEELRDMDPGVASRRLLASFAKEQDDAGCIVIRC